MTDIGERIISRVREVAEKNPDTIYQPVNKEFEGGCMYVANGKPSCIIGHALVAEGFVNSDFERSDSNRLPIDYIWSDIGVSVSYREGLWLGNVQYAQDNGSTWAFSVEFADSEMSNLS